MKNAIILSLGILFTACSHDTEIHRIGIHINNPESDTPDTSLADEIELADESIRFKSPSTVLDGTQPGILYSHDVDFKWVRLRNLENGDNLLFSTVTRNMIFNGEVWAENAELLKSDEERGIYWYKAHSINDDGILYLVWQKL